MFQMISTSVNYAQYYPDASKVSTGSSLITLDLYDVYSNPITISNTHAPILIQIPQKQTSTPSTIRMDGPNSMSTEDSRVDLAYFRANVTVNDSSLHIQILPDDPTVQFLVLARFNKFPALNTTDGQTYGWDYIQLVPSSMANISE